MNSTVDRGGDPNGGPEGRPGGVDQIVDKILEVDPNETILNTLTGGEKSTNSPVRSVSSPTD